MYILHYLIVEDIIMGLFGPKKVEGTGIPVPAGDLKKLLLELFPKEGEVNCHLTIELNEKFPQGFLAVWKFYTRQRKENNSFKYDHFQVTHTINVDIDLNEKAVHFKEKHFMKSARVPEGEPVFDPWYSAVRIGELASIKGEVKKEGLVKVYTYSTKKMFEPLVACATQHGWDAYS